MDMTDSSLFSKFKKLNAEGAFRSLETSLRHSCKDGLADAISALRPEAGAMTWQHVAKACALIDESDSHQPHLLEMCHAEIFLRLYDRLFSGVKRGGARPRKKS